MRAIFQIVYLFTQNQENQQNTNLFIWIHFHSFSLANPFYTITLVAFTPFYATTAFYIFQILKYYSN